MAVISLIGFMGVGKTTIASELAKSLNYKWIDMDKMIEEKQKMTISEIFNQYGEDYFRKLEHETLKEVVQLEDVIIATGGGVVGQQNNRTLLCNHTAVIHLTANAQCILDRIIAQGIDSRPLLAAAEYPLETIHELLWQRKPWYDIAHFQVDTTDQSTEQVVQRIIDCLTVGGMI